MFIIDLVYTKPTREVDVYLEAHRSYLQKYYASHHFIVSGRKDPRTGGIIIANATSPEEMKRIVSEDPFYQHEVATYTITGFTPTMFVEGFDALVPQ